MNKQILLTTVALALGSVASAALAYDPYNPVNTNYEVRLAGSSSSSNSVRTWIIDKVCASMGDIRVYRRGAAPAFGNDWAVACTTKTWLDIDGDGVFDAGEFISAQNVLFRKRDTGGSGFGVTPVTNPAGIQVGFMSINNVNCTAAPVAMGEETPTGTAFNRYQCGSLENLEFPDAGFSDIEPDKFFGLNTPAGFGPHVSGGSIETATFGALVFNTPVTKDLRDALQRVQFDKTTSACNPLNVGYNTAVTPPPIYTGPLPVIMGESEACMPSLTSTEIRSLFTGGVPNWNYFLVTQLGAAPGAAKVALAAHTDNIATAPGDKRVQICRRENGSGTQAQFNAIFLHYPCILNGRTAYSQPGNYLTGPFVANNSGSSDMGKCLDDFNDGTNASGKNAGFVKRWAIGLQSTENNTDLVQNYRFIKINGYAPTIQSVAAGDYEDYAEQSFQYRTVNTVGGAQSATYDKQPIFKYLAARGSIPYDTAGINLAYVHPWGQGGWLVAPKTGGNLPRSPSNPFALFNPVNSSTRGPFHALINICQPPITIRQVEVDTGFSTGKH